MTQVTLMTLYQNPVGPTAEQLIQKGKTWDDIINSASKPGGKDLGF
jgi:filamentous hemagglutinin